MSARGRFRACVSVGAAGLGLIVIAGSAAVWTGCSQPVPRADSEFRGTLLPEALEKPDFTLLDTDGQAFNFREDTAGRLTFLFFGYTNCPDVCPVHMAGLATVLRRLPHEVRDRVTVVFVSTDPDRDTADRIRSWLDGFAADFIGLRGSGEEVDRVQARLGLPSTTRSSGVGDGEYTVGHPAQVIAFTPDELAHVVYPFGTRQADWLHDIPKLLAHEW